MSKVPPRLLYLIIWGVLSAGATEASESRLSNFHESPTTAVGFVVGNIARDRTEPGVSIELRSKPYFGGLRAWTCVFGADDRVRYYGVGAAYHRYVGHQIELGVSFGSGYFKGSQDFDLGYKLEFKTGIELTRIFKSGQKLGLGFGHVSNASLGRRNPGTEYAQVSWHLPLELTNKLKHKHERPESFRSYRKNET